MNPLLNRANLLLDQSRFDLAETECRRALGDDPNDEWATALLALAQSGQKKHKEATTTAESAVALAPDWPFSHYVLASIFADRERLAEAEASVREAIRLDPDAAEYFALLAGIHIQRKHWREGLETAERGLMLDAEDVDCANYRAMCLVKLGRKTDADAAIASALSKQPENAATHATRGWTLLESGDHKKAMEHFREALRLEPDMEWARAGIVEAMKARRIVYRVMLKYFFFMSRLTRRAQMAIIVGAVVLINVFDDIVRGFPALKPFALPLALLYLAFVLMTWISQPLFNLILRLDRFGRLALSDEQRRGANLFGLCILCALLALCGSPWYSWSFGLIGAAMFGILILPTSAIFRCTAGWPRYVMSAYAAILAIFGILVFGGWVSIDASDGIFGNPIRGRSLKSWAELLVLGAQIFVLGAILSTWVGLGLSSIKLRK